MQESNFVAIEYSVIGDDGLFGYSQYNEAIVLNDNGLDLSDLYWGEDSYDS